MLNVAIVAHKYLPHPDDDLVYFLKTKRADSVFHIKHSFPDAPDRKSYYDWYKKSKIFEKKSTIDYKFFPEVFVYVKELVLTLYWIKKTRIIWDIYIGMDGLTTLFGIILKKLGICKKVIYWSIDFVPEGRFQQKWKNKIYFIINKFSYNNVNQIWDLSPRMKKALKKYMDIDGREHKIVPFGVWTKGIKNIPFKNCQKSTLVFMGHLIPNKGIDLIIEKIPEIVKRVPKFKFKIIGGGSYKLELEKKVEKNNIDKYCDFLGRIESDNLMMREIANSAVAIAPYPRNSYAYWADPGKIKTYLAAGVPVLLTDVPWNAKEIVKNKCGIIISNDGEDLVEKLLFLLRPEVNQKFRKNAIKYSKNFDYQNIFSNLDL